MMVRNGWVPRKLNELGFVGRGKSRHRPRNEPSLYGGPYPFVQTADIMASKCYITHYSKTYSEIGLAQSKLWEPNTLCITIAGENTAENAILTFRACFPDSVVGVTPDPEKADLHFVKYYLDTMKRQFKSVTKGATQDNLSLDKLLSFDILTPPLPTQRNIAAILSIYDDLIENNTRRIAILEEMAQAIYREWFLEFCFPGHEKVKMVDSPLGKIPAGWEVSTVNAIVGIRSGYAFSSKAFDEDGQYALVTIKNVHDGNFVNECQSRLSVLPPNLPSYCHLSTGDVLLSLTGNIGRTCFVYGGGYLLNQRVARLVPTDPHNRAFVYCTFRTNEMQAQLERIANGVAQQNLSPVQTGHLPLCIPNQSVLMAFSQASEPIIDEMLVLWRKNNNLRTTRDFLLPKLISGQIDVEDMDIAVDESNGDAEPQATKRTSK